MQLEEHPKGKHLAFSNMGGKTRHFSRGDIFYYYLQPDFYNSVG